MKRFFITEKKYLVNSFEEERLEYYLTNANTSGSGLQRAKAFTTDKAFNFGQNKSTTGDTGWPVWNECTPTFGRTASQTGPAFGTGLGIDSPSRTDCTMADKEDPQQPESLNCPLCLDAFKNPTLLRCGHTFCNVCLDRYDGQNQGQEYMECPVCKKRTKLGHYRVSGLAPNFSVKGLKDELHGKVIGSSSNFCSIHSDIYKDILCEDCEEFICLSCFFDNHQGHKIKKKEKLEAVLKKKREALVQKLQLKKVQIETFIVDSEKDKWDIRTRLQNLHQEIEEAFDKRVAILLENKRRLSEEAETVCMNSHEIVEIEIAHQRKAIDNIENHLTVQKSNVNKNLDSYALKVLQTQLTDLEKEMEKDFDNTPLAHALEKVKNVWFHEAEGAVLDFGCLEQQPKATYCDFPQVETVSGVSSMEEGSSNECPSVSNNSAGQEGICEEADEPTALQDLPMTVVRKIDLPYRQCGMGEGSSNTCPSVGNNSVLQERICDGVDKPIVLQDLPITKVEKIDFPDIRSIMEEGSSNDCPSVSSNSVGQEGICHGTDKSTALQHLPMTNVQKIDLPDHQCGMEEEGSFNDCPSVSNKSVGQEGRCDGVDKQTALQDLPVTIVQKIRLPDTRSSVGKGLTQDCSGAGNNEEVQEIIQASRRPTDEDINEQTTVQKPPVLIVSKTDLPDDVSGMVIVPSQDHADVSSNAEEPPSVPGSSIMADIHMENPSPSVSIARTTDLPNEASSMETEDRAGVNINAGELPNVPGCSTMVDIHMEMQSPSVSIGKTADLPHTVSCMETKDCASVSSNAGELPNVPESSSMVDVHMEMPSASVSIGRTTDLPHTVSYMETKDCAGVRSIAGDLQSVPGISTMADVHATVQNLPEGIARNVPDSAAGIRTTLSQNSLHVRGNTGEIQNVHCSTVASIQNPQLANVTEIDSCMTNAGRCSVGEVPGTSTVADIPILMQNTAVTIMKVFDLPARVSGMAATRSRDAVVIGYGKNKDGADSFSLTGSKTTYLNNRVGPVCDISFLNDGKLVVSHGPSFGIYSMQDGSLHDTRHDFRCRQNRNFSARLCVDQNDKVYGVNCNSKVNIFHGQTTTRRHIVYPLKVETLCLRAAQICVARTGAMIVSSCNRGLSSSSVVVYRRFVKDGPLMNEIGVRADDEEEDQFLYAAIDTRDRVLVARVMNGSDLFSLTRYTLNGISLTKTTVFKAFRLPHSIDDSSSWCYMVSITPNLIAFATGIHLYFMQLPL